jgi:DNA repair protein RecO
LTAGPICWTSATPSSPRRGTRIFPPSASGAELVSNLFEEQDPHVTLFDRMARTITEVATDRCEEAMLAFVLDVLRESGDLPELAHCVQCGLELPRGPIFFSPSAGGVICKPCEHMTADRLPIDPLLLGIIQNFLRLPKENGTPVRLPRLTRAQTDPLNAMFVRHVEHVLGKPLRLREYVLG